MQITMLYLQENIRQQTLASVFGTSQPTISRAINIVLNILDLDVVLPPPPQPGDLNPNKLYVLDGTLIPCWWWKNARNLYSGKHHRAGHNLQILTDQAGEIFYISEPLPGSTHDITAIRSTGLFGYMQPWHCTADIRICGVRVRYAFEEKTRETFTGVAATIQQGYQPDPVCCRTIHSPPESMADSIYPLQAPPTHNHPGNQHDTKDNVLPTTNRTMFPQQLNKLPSWGLRHWRSHPSSP